MIFSIARKKAALDALPASADPHPSPPAIQAARHAPEQLRQLRVLRVQKRLALAGSARAHLDGRDQVEGDGAPLCPGQRARGSGTYSEKKAVAGVNSPHWCPEVQHACRTFARGTGARHAGQTTPCCSKACLSAPAGDPCEPTPASVGAASDFDASSTRARIAVAGSE